MKSRSLQQLSHPQLKTPSSTEEESTEGSASSDEPQLATASVTSRLTNQAGRAIVSARGNHFIVDSVPPIEGPNEELNPLDMMLSALGTCGIFIVEKVALDMNWSVDGTTVLVEGDFDPSGVAGADVNPRIQLFRVMFDLQDISDEQAAEFEEQFKTRCPIYTTLERSAPIEIYTNSATTTAPTEGLATAAVKVQLSNQPGRAIVTARGNHFVIDSVPPLDGPNEERNPLDLMLGALATCGTFIYERVAQEQGIEMTEITTTVEGDFDPRGVAGQPVDPRIQTMRVSFEVPGVSEPDTALMQEQFEQRCPVFTTLVRATDIEVAHSE